MDSPALALRGVDDRESCLRPRRTDHQLQFGRSSAIRSGQVGSEVQRADDPALSIRRLPYPRPGRSFVASLRDGCATLDPGTASGSRAPPSGRRLFLAGWGRQPFDGNVRKQPVVVGTWLGSAGALMCASYAVGESVVSGLVDVFGVLLPASYWDALRPGMPDLKLRSSDTVSWVQDRQQDYAPKDATGRGCGWRVRPGGPRPRVAPKWHQTGSSNQRHGLTFVRLAQVSGLCAAARSSSRAS